MEKNVRSRRFSFLRNFYFETHNEQGQRVSKMSENEWKQSVLEDVKNVKAQELWLIFHNADFDDGTKKPLHCHGIAIFSNPHDSNSLKSALHVRNDSHNKFVQKIKSDVGSFRYLTHTSEAAMVAKKNRYEIHELYLFVDGKMITNENDKKLLYEKRISGHEKSESIVVNKAIDGYIAEVASGTLSLTNAKNEIQNSFGNSGLTAYVKNNRNFKNAVEVYRESHRREMLAKGRNLKTVFIFGPSGIGKSSWVKSFAKVICDNENCEWPANVYNTATSSLHSDFELLAGYEEFEKITVIDDVEANSFSMAEFLKDFDPFEVPQVHTRYKNRYWYSERAFIIKSVESVDEYFRPIYSKNTGTYTQNDRKQVLRRIAASVRIDSNKLILTMNEDSFCHGKTYSFPFEFDFNKLTETDSKKLLKLNEQIYKILY